MSVPAQLETDTIVAIATPPGRGGVGVVRLSGPASLPIALHIVILRAAPVSRRVQYGLVLDAGGRRLDDALLTWFQAPGSYTGEDVVEVSTHGSPVVLHAVVNAALLAGARLARPGEFTERAYLAGRLDLTAAEAVRDLIDAQTIDQVRLAAEQVGGSLAREVAPIKRALLELIATLEAGIDFAEDDLDTLSDTQIAERIAPLLPPLQRLEESFTHGRLLREGLKLALVGKPNAGKSSLFNRLLGRDRAIVTPVAGTTRDVVSEQILLQGIPILLLDTAGLRDTTDAVESIGVARSYETIAEADVVLHLVDATDPDSAAALEEWPGLRQHTIRKGDTVPHNISDASSGSGASGMPGVLRVLTKADLLSPPTQIPLASTAPLGSRHVPLRKAEHDALTVNQNTVVATQPPAERKLLQASKPSGTQTLTETPSTFGPAVVNAPEEILLTSSTTGQGIANLQNAIIRLARRGIGDTPHAATLTNLRQHQAIATALDVLQRAPNRKIPHEMLLLDLYQAMDSLDTLTGTTTSDDVLNLIFSTFCIGK